MVQRMIVKWPWVARHFLHCSWLQAPRAWCLYRGCRGLSTLETVVAPIRLLTLDLPVVCSTWLLILVLLIRFQSQKNDVVSVIEIHVKGANTAADCWSNACLLWYLYTHECFVCTVCLAWLSSYAKCISWTDICAQCNLDHIALGLMIVGIALFGYRRFKSLRDQPTAKWDCYEDIYLWGCKWLPSLQNAS